MHDEALQRIGHLYPPVTITNEILSGRPDLKEQGLKEGDHLPVIAWIWARTVKCPNPACGAQMPLTASFALSTKKGKEAWIEPVIVGKEISFSVKISKGKGPNGTVNRNGAKCICCGVPVPFDYVRSEGKSGRINSQMMAIVAEGEKGKCYLSPLDNQIKIAKSTSPKNVPDTDLPAQALGFRVQNYGLLKHRDLFSSRQLTALVTFSDLILEFQEKVKDKSQAKLNNTFGISYEAAVATYLAFAVDRFADYWSTLNSWQAANQQFSHTFARQALPMVWNYAEANPFSGLGGSFDNLFDWTIQSLNLLISEPPGKAYQDDAASLTEISEKAIISTDPPYYDNVSYSDLSDFFYVWLRSS